MADRLPPLHLLTAFEAVARLGSFARAADELCLTQSAVSHRIRRLERQLEVDLLLRGGKRIAVTDAGRQLLHTVRDVMTRLQQATADLATSRRRLRISMAPAIANFWLVPRLRTFQALHPGVELEIHATLEIVDLKAGEADVGVRSGPGNWPGLEAMRLSHEMLVPVCAPGYPASIGGLRRPQDLSRAMLIRNDRLAWSPWLRAAGLDWPEPGDGPLYSEVGTMLEAAAAGQGVALMLSTMADLLVREGRLIRPLLEAVPSPYSYYAVFRPGADARPEVRDFVAWLAGEFGLLRQRHPVVNRQPSCSPSSN
jgi:LysR family glycine cleavage system transcriptional activator